MRSFDIKGIKEKNFLDDIIDDKEGMLEQVSFKLKGRDEQFIFFVRLFFVFFLFLRRKDGGGLEGGYKLNDWKKVMLRGGFV